MATLGATSLTGCSSIPKFLGGSTDTPGNPTKTIFQNATAPVSWTKVTSPSTSGIMLRVVNGASLSPGGSKTFTQLFSSAYPLSIINDNTALQGTVSSVDAFPSPVTSTPSGSFSTLPATLTTSQMTAHTHIAGDTSITGTTPGGGSTIAGSQNTPQAYTTAPIGASGSHSHSVNAHTHTLGGRSIQHTHPGYVHGHTTPTSQNLDILYVDMILATKN